MDVDDPLYASCEDYPDISKDVDEPSAIDDEQESPTLSLDDIQKDLLLKKIDAFIPILKISLFCLEQRKDETNIKNDYQKLSHAYDVFSNGKPDEKLDLYAVSQNTLEKLFDEYKKYLKKRKENNGNENSNSSQTPAVVIPNLSVPVVPTSSTSIIPIVHNVVATVDLGCKLELTKIALAARNVEYNPRRFHAVIMRLHEPRTATLIFKTGKIVTIGAKSETAAHLAARKCARIIQKLGNNVKFFNFKIQNMVATCDVRFPIHVENLYKAHAQFCSYEPELFAGLIYRLVKPKLSLLIFVTGKFVLTGGKSREMLYEACDYIYPVLRSFRKQ